VGTAAFGCPPSKARQVCLAFVWRGRFRPRGPGGTTDNSPPVSRAGSNIAFPASCRSTIETGSRFLKPYLLPPPNRFGMEIGRVAGGGPVPDAAPPMAGTGNTNSGSSRNALLPAFTVTSTSRGGLKPPLAGTTLARPLLSVVALFCVTFKITGMAGFPGLVSPLPTPGTIPPGRNTVVRKLTGAANTGCGEAAESTTRTTTG